MDDESLNGRGEFFFIYIEKALDTKRYLISLYIKMMQPQILFEYVLFFK